MSEPDLLIFSDLSLARRLERTEAHSNARFVEARARAFPDSGAEWIEVAGAYAMYDGAASPLTQTFGLGLFETVTEAALDRLELFFRERGAPIFHEVSPLAEPGLLELFHARGYRPIEFTSVLFRQIYPSGTYAVERNENIRVRRISADEQELWGKTAAQGWSDSPEIAEFLADLAAVNSQNKSSLSFLAELEGVPIATGALGISEGVAMLAGASTVPTGRKQGAQLALLNARLRFAAEQGCDIAMMGALPGSASQRNAERQGFRIAYTRIKWQLAD